jgi:hypothetical protein
VVSGRKEEIAEAKAAILEIANSVGEEKLETVIVDNKFHRSIIGAGGQGLRELIIRCGGPAEPRDQVGLIRFPPASEASDEIRLRGEPKLVAKIKAELEQTAADLRDRVVMGVEIPAAMHRALIGRGGQHLNDLQSRTGTQVQFPGSRSYNFVGESINAADLVDVDPANIVKVSGPKSKAEQAIAELKVSCLCHCHYLHILIKCYIIDCGHQGGPPTSPTAHASAFLECRYHVDRHCPAQVPPCHLKPGPLFPEPQSLWCPCRPLHHAGQARCAEASRQRCLRCTHRRHRRRRWQHQVAGH